MKPLAGKDGIAVLGTSALADYAALTKPGLTTFSVATAVAAAALGAGDVTDYRVVATLAGTWLIGGGAGALNQVLERRHDALMRRTAGRPLPAAKLRPRAATVFGITLSILGIATLWLTAGTLPAGLGAATLLTYLMLYTPMKRLTPFAYVAGGIPGALPPVIGWAAGRGEVGLEAWVLFSLLFFWQMPHFLSLGWLYRHDYERARYPVLSLFDATGTVTARQMLVYSFLLLPTVALGMIVGLAGPLFVVGGAVVSLFFLVVVTAFAFRRSNQRARAVFLTSLAVLPALFGLLLLERLL